MKKLLPILLILSGCMRAQQSFPGVNITPSGGAAGKVQFRTSGNVNSMFIQDNTLDATGLGARAATFIGSASAPASPFEFRSTNGYLVTFCDVGTTGSWMLTRIRIVAWSGSSTCGSGTSNMYLDTDGTIATSLGTCMFESAGLSGDYVCLRAPSGAVTSPYTINLPGTGPSVAGQSLSWVSGSTYAWTSSTGANTTLSNLTSPTAVNQDLLPGASVTYSLGADTVSGRWKDGAVGDWDVGDDIFQGDAGFPTLRKITITAPAGGFSANWTWQWPVSGGTSGYVLSTDGTGATSWIAATGTGTVTSVGQSFTGGLISVSGSPITSSGTLALTVAGTSGGVPYFSSGSTWASSAALTANLPVIGGGAGGAPSVGTRSGNTTTFVTTTGTQTQGRCVTIDANGNHIPDAQNCFSNPMSATGDIIYSGNSLGTPARLAVGSAGQVLSVSSSFGNPPAWLTLSGTSPISYSSGAISCSTCVTTAGGQTIGGTLSMTELRISGNTVINTSGILANSFGVDVNAGVAGTGFNIHGGASGVTQTLNVATSVLGTCTITVTGGIITASTC